MKHLLILICLVIPFILHARENPANTVKNHSSVTLAVNCFPASSSIELNINNVRMTLLCGGDMWWNLFDAKYEIPTGSNKHSMFAGALWIGGIDGGGQVRVAAQTYRQTGNDFWPGAIDTTITDIVASRCQAYDRHWKVSRQQVLNFVNNGTTTSDIISWPGNGNPTFHESHYLAPFFDNNGDGIYNHLDGDYPGFNLSNIYPTFNGTSYSLCNDYLFGDTNIWWVINDVGNIHTETGSLPIGLEIRCQAFAYQSNNPAINNSTFYKYQVINRSSSVFSNMYFGQWVDPDLGNWVDDYVGCDVIRGLGYCYNGDADDEGASGYGLNPPAIGVDFLQGPYADVGDGIDNDRDLCLDCTFIDSAGVTIVIPDNVLPEPIAMSKFVYYNNVNSSPTGNPSTAANFYNYLRGMWLDNQPITYGGDGRNPNNPPCSYMFPGTTDPLFTTNWTEVTASNIPNDRRFLQSAGQFTLMPGAVHYITTGVIWARATSGGPLASVALLQQHDDFVQQYFDNCFRLQGVGTEEISGQVEVKIFPNPTGRFLTVSGKQLRGVCKIKIYDVAGNLVLNRMEDGNHSPTLDLSSFNNGVYLIEVSNGQQKIYSGKFVKQ
jgi:hypothetical protein